VSSGTAGEEAHDFSRTFHPTVSPLNMLHTNAFIHTSLRQPGHCARISQSGQDCRLSNPPPTFHSRGHARHSRNRPCLAPCAECGSHGKSRDRESGGTDHPCLMAPGVLLDAQGSGGPACGGSSDHVRLLGGDMGLLDCSVRDGLSLAGRTVCDSLREPPPARRASAWAQWRASCRAPPRPPAPAYQEPQRGGQARSRSRHQRHAARRRGEDTPSRRRRAARA